MNLQVPTSARDHVRGGPAAPVTLVEYADFECPFSGRAYPIVKKLLARFGADVRLVFRHKPATHLHPHAQLAAQAAEAAGLQGKFWPMHDLLFKHQKSLSESAIRRFASELDLDRERFLADLHSPAVVGRVAADDQSATLSHVRGTPSFFVDGIPYQERVSTDALGGAIERALQKRRASRGARLVSSVKSVTAVKQRTALDRSGEEANLGSEGEDSDEVDDAADAAHLRRRHLRRRDTPGHIDPRYRAMLLRESGHARDPEETHAFLTGNKSSDVLAEQLGEEFLESATRGQDEGDDRFNQGVPEDEGGPFVETNAGTEFAPGTDASNIPGATREPFPKT